MENYKEALTIWESLNKEEQLFVTPSGLFVDSQRLICRFVHYEHNELAGFIDAYQLKKSRTAFLVVAVSEKYRRKGIAKSLMYKVEQELIRKDYHRIDYVVNKDNLSSISLANSCNYSFLGEKEDKVIFRKYLR